MDSLTKSQKDEYATSYAILALFDGGVSDRIGDVLVPVFILEFARDGTVLAFMNSVETAGGRRGVSSKRQCFITNLFFVLFLPNYV